MNKHPQRLDIALPDWLLQYAEGARGLDGHAARMDFVIGAARLNSDRGGGPFAAGVFDADSGALVALGVNLVLGAKLSVLHAEVVAIAAAQARLESFDLGAPGLPAHELVSSAEPCAMCLGAVHWSGVRRLVVGARGADVEASGFDEGPKPADWRMELMRRGVAVAADVRRAAAAAVIAGYARRGGYIYNPGKR